MYFVDGPKCKHQVLWIAFLATFRRLEVFESISFCELFPVVFWRYLFRPIRILIRFTTLACSGHYCLWEKDKGKKKKKCIRVKSTKLLSPGNVFQIPAFYEQKNPRKQNNTPILKIFLYFTNYDYLHILGLFWLLPL